MFTPCQENSFFILPVKPPLTSVCLLTQWPKLITKFIPKRVTGHFSFLWGFKLLNGCSVVERSHFCTITPFVAGVHSSATASPCFVYGVATHSALQHRAPKVSISLSRCLGTHLDLNATQTAPLPLTWIDEGPRLSDSQTQLHCCGLPRCLSHPERPRSHRHAVCLTDYISVCRRYF